jgi:cell shape-determining protein MreD
VSYYVGVPLLLLSALVEASVLPVFRVAGVQPNLTLLLLVAWMTVRGQEEVFYLIPVAGIFLGLVESAPMGAALIALAPVALLHELRSLHLGDGQLPIAITFAIFATLLYDLVYVVVHLISGSLGPIQGVILDVMLPSLVINAIFVVPVYALVLLFSQDIRRSAFA